MQRITRCARRGSKRTKQPTTARGERRPVWFCLRPGPDAPPRPHGGAYFYV